MDEALSQLLDPGNLAMNLVGGLAIQLVYYYFLARVLPPRSRRAYWASAVLVAVGVLFAKPLLPPAVRMVAALAINMGFPVVMLRGSLSLRVVVSVVGCLAETVGEVAYMVLWMALTGLGKVDNVVVLEHLPAHLMALVFGSMGAMALVMQGVKAAVDRLGVAPAGDTTRVARRSWVARYIWFVLAQLLLVYAVVFLGYDCMGWTGSSVPVVVVLLALCAAADGALFVQIGRSVARERQEARARMLEQQVDAYLAGVEPLQAMLDDTARLRHDLRNHRGVVQTLCARGDHGRAQAYLEELSGRIGCE